MRRTSCTVFLLFLTFVLLTAMGGKGGGFERAPRVDKNFAVTVTDVDVEDVQKAAVGVVVSVEPTGVGAATSMESGFPVPYYVLAFIIRVA